MKTTGNGQATKTGTELKTIRDPRTKKPVYTAFSQAVLANKGKKATAGEYRFGGGQTLKVDVDEETLTSAQIKKVVDFVVKDRRVVDHTVSSVLRQIG